MHKLANLREKSTNHEPFLSLPIFDVQHYLINKKHNSNGLGVSLENYKLLGYYYFNILTSPIWDTMPRNFQNTFEDIIPFYLQLS